MSSGSSPQTASQRGSSWTGGRRCTTGPGQPSRPRLRRPHRVPNPSPHCLQSHRRVPRPNRRRPQSRHRVSSLCNYRPRQTPLLPPQRRERVTGIRWFPSPPPNLPTLPPTNYDCRSGRAVGGGSREHRLRRRPISHWGWTPQQGGAEPTTESRLRHRVRRLGPERVGVGVRPFPPQPGRAFDACRWGNDHDIGHRTPRPPLHCPRR